MGNNSSKTPTPFASLMAKRFDIAHQNGWLSVIGWTSWTKSFIKTRQKKRAGNMGRGARRPTNATSRLGTQSNGQTDLSVRFFNGLYLS